MDLMQADGGSTSRQAISSSSSNGSLFSCIECGKSFMHERTLKRHKLTHNMPNQFACTECGKQYSQAYDLERHSRCHSGDRPFKCALCNRQFLLSHHLTNHMITHTGLRPYCCLVCPKQFAQSFSLKRHMRLHLRLEGQSSDGADVSADGTNGAADLLYGSSQLDRLALLRSLSCQRCGKVFCSPQTLSRHRCLPPLTDDASDMFSGHLLPPPTSQQRAAATYEHRGSTGVKLHVTRFFSKRGSRRCRQCGTSFDSTSQLQEHVSAVHPEELRPYACTSCSKRFAHRYSLKRHRVEHGDGEAITCPTCGKRFAQGYELKRHLKSHRSLHDQAICTICSRNFPNNSNDSPAELPTCDACLRVGFASRDIKPL